MIIFPSLINNISPYLEDYYYVQIDLLDGSYVCCFRIVMTLCRLMSWLARPNDAWRTRSAGASIQVPLASSSSFFLVFFFLGLCFSHDWERPDARESSPRTSTMWLPCLGRGTERGRWGKPRRLLRDVSYLYFNFFIYKYVGFLWPN